MMKNRVCKHNFAKSTSTQNMSLANNIKHPYILLVVITLAIALLISSFSVALANTTNPDEIVGVIPGQGYVTYAQHQQYAQENNNNESTETERSQNFTENTDSNNTTDDANQNATLATGTVNGTSFTVDTAKKLWSKISGVSNATIVINMNADCFYDKYLNVGSGTTMTLNLNGHQFGQSDDAGTWSNDYYIFKLNSTSNLTINGGTTSLSHSVKVYKDLDAGTKNITVYGGVVTSCQNNQYGGAFYIPNSASNAKLTINQTTIAGNKIETYYKTGAYGGAICSQGENFNLELNGSTITGNYSENCGGAIATFDNPMTLKATDSTIESNFCSNDGAALYFEDGASKVSLTNTKINNNMSKSDGAGIYVYNDAGGTSIEATDSEFNTNTAYGDGGAMCFAQNLVQEDTGSTITLTSCELNGNKADDGAGIYHTPNNSVFKITDSEMNNNEGTDSNNYGGAIYNSANDTAFYVNGSTFNNNKAQYGGGFYNTGHGVTISGNANQGDETQGTTISGNVTTNDGAGVYTFIEGTLQQRGTSISGINITDNVSGDCGGGVSINSESCTISNCNFLRNQCSDTGSAADIDQDYTSMSNCDVFDNVNNSSDDEGAIYVDNDVDLFLSGTMRVYNNTLKSGSASDIVLGNGILGDTWLYCEGINSSSRIGVTRESLSKGENKVKLTNYADTFDTRCYFSNNKNYGITYTSQFDGGDGILYFEKGKHTDMQDFKQSTVIDPSEEESTTDETINGYEVIKKYAKYGTVADAICDNATPFYYSDGYFIGDEGFETKYNKAFATLSMAMAMSAFTTREGGIVQTESNSGEVGLTSEGYINSSANIMQFFGDIGCEQDDIYVNDNFLTQPTADTIGVGIAKKQITLQESDDQADSEQNSDDQAAEAQNSDDQANNDKGANDQDGASGDENNASATNENDSITLVPVALRGAGYEAEWASNLTLGTTGQASGFATAADQTFEEVKNYVASHNLEEQAKAGKLRFWITGFSRGGAVANILSKKLIDYYRGTDYNKKNLVIAYTFESPNGGQQSEITASDINYQGMYSSIHNVVNASDSIPAFGPTKMGFIKYGVCHYSPGSDEVNDPVKGSDNNYYDNVAWVAKHGTQTEDYGNLRTSMKKHLACLDCVDEPLYFDDYFQTATMNFVYKYLGLDTHYVEYKGTGDNNYNASYYISSVMDAICEHGLTYKSTPRESYTADVTIGSSNYGSVEKSLSAIMRIIFSKDAATSSAILNAAYSIPSKLNTSGLYFDVLGNWSGLSDTEKNSYIKDIVNLITERKYDGTSVADYLTDEEIQELSTNLPALLDTVARFVNWDHKNKTLGVDDTDIYTGTLIGNMSRIFVNHYQETTMAWLRAADSDHYGNEISDPDPSKHKTYQVKAITPDNPKLKLTQNKQASWGQAQQGDDEQAGQNEIVVNGNDSTEIVKSCYMSLYTENNPGSAIFYTTDGSDPKTSTTRKLYRGPEYLEEPETGVKEYTIKAYSYAYGVPSTDVVTFTIDVYGKYEYKMSKYTGKGDTGYDVKTYNEYPDTEVNITCQSEVSGKNFSYWTATNAEGTDVTKAVFGTEGAENLNTTEFTMPKYNVDIKNNYFRDGIDVQLSTEAKMKDLPITPQVGTKLSPTVNIKWTKIDKEGHRSDIKTVADYNGTWYKVNSVSGEVPSSEQSTSGIAEYDTQYAFVVNLQEDLANATPITYDPDAKDSDGYYHIYDKISSELNTLGLGTFKTIYNESDYSVTLIYYPPKTSGTATDDAAITTLANDDTYDTTPVYVNNIEKTLYFSYDADPEKVKDAIEARSAVAVDSQVIQTYNAPTPTPEASYYNVGSGISLDLDSSTFTIPTNPDGKTKAGESFDITVTSKDKISSDGRIKVKDGATAKIKGIVSTTAQTSIPPTPDKEANRTYYVTYDGSASTSQQQNFNLTLTAKTGEKIQYSTDGSNFVDYPSAGITIVAPNLTKDGSGNIIGNGSAIKSVWAKVVSSTTNADLSATVKYDYTIINRAKFGITMNFEVDGFDDDYKATVKPDPQTYYYYLDSTPFSVVAPTHQYEGFTSWSESTEQGFIPTGKESSHGFTKSYDTSEYFNKNITILGTYYPVITGVVGHVDSLDPNSAYPETVYAKEGEVTKSFYFTSRQNSGCSDPKNTLDLSWTGQTSATKTNPGFNEDNQAVITIPSDYITRANMKFGVKAGTTTNKIIYVTPDSTNSEVEKEAEINFTNIEKSRIVKTFHTVSETVTTRKAYIKSITAPNVTDIPNGTSIEDIVKNYLTSNVEITSEIDSVNSAVVAWDTSKIDPVYDPTSLNSGTYKIPGKVTLPSSLDNPTGEGHVSLDIKGTFSVKEANHVMTPTSSKQSGDYFSVKATLACSTEGATIYYTTDGTDPTSSATRKTYIGETLEFTGKIGEAVVHTLKIYAEKSGMLASEINEYKYTVDYSKYKNELISKDQQWKQLSETPYNFKISDFAENSTLLSLTFDGSETPMVLDTDYTMQITKVEDPSKNYEYELSFAVSPDFLKDKAVGTHKFTADFITGPLDIDFAIVEADACDVPTPTVTEGSYYQVVTKLTCDTVDAEIYYTTDGSDPSRESNTGKLYDGEDITFESNPQAVEKHTIKTIAYKDGMTESAVGSYTYTLDYSLKPKPGPEPEPEPEPEPTPTPQPENVDTVGAGAGTSSTGDSATGTLVFAGILTLCCVGVIAARRRRAK